MRNELKEFKVVVTVENHEVHHRWMYGLQDVCGAFYYLLENAGKITILGRPKGEVVFTKDVDYDRSYINEYSGLTLIRGESKGPIEWYSKIKLGDTKMKEIVFDVPQHIYDEYVSAIQDE